MDTTNFALSSWFQSYNVALGRPERLRGMLQRLGDHISACLQRADKCREAAASASDEHVRRQLLDLEQQWRHVAKTYEFVASLERFLLDQQNHTLPREVEKLPKDAPKLEEPTA
jgi:hypothetical protein